MPQGTAKSAKTLVRGLSSSNCVDTLIDQEEKRREQLIPSISSTFNKHRLQYKASDYSKPDSSRGKTVSTAAFLTELGQRVDSHTQVK